MFINKIFLVDKMFIQFVEFQLVVGCVSSVTSFEVTIEVSRSHMRFLMALQRYVCEISRLVRAELTHEHSLCLVVVHHMLLEQNPRSENLLTDVTRALLNTMSVSHVIKE